MSKVEEVAEAIGCPSAGMDCGFLEPRNCANCRLRARAAIEAKREPTEAMVGRGYEAMDGYGYAEPKACWRNMVDSALQNR